VEAIQKALFDSQGQLLRDQCQKAFPLLVTTVIPVGVRGIVIAGLLAALMSSLAGVFNASSTLFTIDFYSKFRPNASQHRLVWVGRVATTIMVLIGLMWIPVIRGGKGLYDYLQGVQAYLAPPIFVVFFLGVFMKRLNGKGCIAALIAGFAMGLFRLAVDTPVKLLGDFTYSQGSFFWVVNNIFFQYYSMLILAVCIIVMVVVSYMTEPPVDERIRGLTYGTLTAEDREKHATLSEGRFPIKNASQARSALKLRGHTKNKAERRAVIRRAAKFLPDAAKAALESDKKAGLL